MMSLIDYEISWQIQIKLNPFVFVMYVTYSVTSFSDSVRMLRSNSVFQELWPWHLNSPTINVLCIYQFPKTCHYTSSESHYHLYVTLRVISSSNSNQCYLETLIHQIVNFKLSSLERNKFSFRSHHINKKILCLM